MEVSAPEGDDIHLGVATPMLVASLLLWVENERAKDAIMMTDRMDRIAFMVRGEERGAVRR
jgi:hypothetical protein